MRHQVSQLTDRFVHLALYFVDNVVKYHYYYYYYYYRYYYCCCCRHHYKY